MDMAIFKKKKGGKKKNIISALRQLFWSWRQSSHSLGILLEIRLYLMQKAFTKLGFTSFDIDGKRWFLYSNLANSCASLF